MKKFNSIKQDKSSLDSRGNKLVKHHCVNGRKLTVQLSTSRIIDLTLFFVNNTPTEALPGPADVV